MTFRLNSFDDVYLIIRLFFAYITFYEIAYATLPPSIWDINNKQQVQFNKTIGEDRYPWMYLN